MPPTKPASPHVALLRGVNVGGNNLLPMKDLAAVFLEAGCADVRTYIQSGNVVFSAPPRIVDRLTARVERRIAERFGFRAPVILRSLSQLEDVIRANPFLKPGVAENMLHVLFLADSPDAKSAASLDPHRSPPDAFVLLQSEIYLHLPNGAGKSKLTNAYFDSKLATICTGRNWRTVLKLHEMLRGNAG